MKKGDAVYCVSDRDKNEWTKGTIVKQGIFGRFIVEHSFDLFQHRDYGTTRKKYSQHDLTRELPEDATVITLYSEDLSVAAKDHPRGFQRLGEKL